MEIVVNYDIMRNAESIARKSPCLRRKYGAIIVDNDIEVSRGFNTRVGRCCEGNICVRDRLQRPHGTGIEAGAEIHAEMMALLDWDVYHDSESPLVMYLAGFDKHGNPLTGSDVWPCHMCSLLIKYRGIKHMVLKSSNDELSVVTIDEILYEQELAWEEVYA